MNTFKGRIEELLKKVRASGSAVFDMLRGNETKDEIKAMEQYSPFVHMAENERRGESYWSGGKHIGQLKHERAQAEYVEIRKEYAHVSLCMPHATKKTLIQATARHKNVSVSKVRDALKEK